MSTQVHALNSHSTLVCKGKHASRFAITRFGSMHNASMWKPQEDSVSVDRQWAEGRGTRGFSAAAADDSHGPEETEFHLRAERTLEHFQERIEAFVEDAELDESDVEYTMGVMNIKLGSLGTYVLNKQAPNRQLWLSSPISGPVRYDFDAANGCWVCVRDGHKLHELLQKELSGLLGGELSL